MTFLNHKMSSIGRDITTDLLLRSPNPRPTQKSTLGAVITLSRDMKVFGTMTSHGASFQQLRFVNPQYNVN